MSADDLSTPASTTPADATAEATPKPVRSDNDLGASRIAHKRMGQILNGAEARHVLLPSGEKVLAITYFVGPLDADMIRNTRAEFAKQSKAAKKGGEDDKEAEKAYNDAQRGGEAMLESGESYLDRYYRHGAGTGRSAFFPPLGQSQSLPGKLRAFGNGLRMDAQQNNWMSKLPGMDPRAFDAAADDLEVKQAHAEAQGSAVQTARTLRDLAGKDLRALVKEAEALVRELHKLDPAALLDYGIKPYRTKAGDPARLTPRAKVATDDAGKGKRGKA